MSEPGDIDGLGIKLTVRAKDITPAKNYIYDKTVIGD